MKKLTRRRLIATGLATAAGGSGLAIAAKLATRYGLLPPDAGGLYGPGNTLTYASQRLLTRQSLAREFRKDQISRRPFANGRPPEFPEFLRLQGDSFRDWRLTVDGLVAHPASFSLADLRALPSRTQITQLVCEEGWSFIAEWTGVPLSRVLEQAGALPQARYVVYRSLEEGWWGSVDMADALHPQTILAYSMNGGELPAGHGGPLRIRVPRQLGYKSVKYLAGLTLTDDPKRASDGGDYAWYAGI